MECYKNPCEWCPLKIQGICGHLRISVTSTSTLLSVKLACEAADGVCKTQLSQMYGFATQAADDWAGSFGHPGKIKLLELTLICGEVLHSTQLTIPPKPDNSGTTP